MMKYVKNLIPAKKQPEQNRISTQASGSSGIQNVRKRVYRQAALTVMTITLTVVILFAMTSAWYTNVVQTSGLSFEAESWGFDGNITITSENILASPGDEGIIDLTVENNHDSVAAVSVNIAKNGMTEAMQKRLFFYVDTRMNRSGETLERVYLNRYEGYTYNVFNNGSLTLTADYNNAPVIKWEWVYDVLGYYVVAEPYDLELTGEDGTVTNVHKMVVKEYLRPISYDFDEITTKINTAGESITIDLETIDGQMTPAKFVEELSKADGYEGTIDASNGFVLGDYYPVKVDENGYGVYIYLCNYAQIQQETNYDAYLGELAYHKAKGETLTEDQLQELRHGVTVSLSAQKNDEIIVPIVTLQALQEELATGTADVIRLENNVTLAKGETLTILEDKRVMMDLNGHTVTNTDGVAVTMMPGSSLTLVNGTLQQAEQSGTTYGIRATGAEVVLSNIKINEFQMGLYVGDNSNNNVLDSRIHIMDSVIDVENCAAFISGNGALSKQKSQLIIEGSTLTSHNMVIAGNGDTSGNGRWGTDIQIINSTIKGTRMEGASYDSVGIYQPQKASTLTIRDSHVEGGTGIALKGGSAKIYHSTIAGNGSYNEPTFEGSGSTNTGDAIYIETNYGYDIQLWLSADSELSVEAEECKGLRVYEENAPNVYVEIEEVNNENTESE